MKGRQLAIVLALLVAVGGAAMFLSRRNAETWSSTATSADAKILNFPLNDVSHIRIAEQGHEVNMIRQEGGWKVKERADYPANFELISALIRKFWELRAVQDVKVGPSQFGRLQLLEPSQGAANTGTLLELKGDGDKTIAGLILGKKYLRQTDDSAGPGGAFPTGRYVRSTDSSNRVSLVAETLDDVDSKPEHWLNRDFVRIDNPKTITLTGTTPEMNWRLTRDSATAQWKLAEAKPGEELDNAKVSALTTLFAGGTFADVAAPDAKPADTGLDKPTTATIETFDNFVYTLRIGKLMGENYPVLVSVVANLPNERLPGKDEKPEDKAKLDQEFQTAQAKLKEKLANEQKIEKRPFLIAKSTIEQLLKSRSALLAEKKPAASPSPTGTPAKPSPAPKRRAK